MRSMKGVLCCALGLWLAGCATTAPAPVSTDKTPDPLDAQLSMDPEVVTGELANGLRYVIRKNAKPEKRAELRLTINVGSILEEDAQQGLAHFVEHMAFNGTRNFAKQELVDYLESIGMRFGPDLNAYTSFDETVYMLTVPTDSAGVVDQAFQILEDWAHQMSFDAEEIDKERGVVVEEWRLRRGAQQRMLDQMLPILLKDSRYAQRLPIGVKAVIDTFEHASLRDFYRTWYRPDLMGFVAVGDFEPAHMESLIQVYFSRIPIHKDPRERMYYPIPDHQETLFSITTDPEATYNSISIYSKQDVRDQSTVATYRRSLVESLYHQIFNQRLQELTKQAEPPFLYGYSSQGRLLRTKETFVLGAMVANNGFDQGLHALLVESARVRLYGFTAGELARAKKEAMRGIEQAYREYDKQQSAMFAAEYVRYLLEDEAIPGIAREYQLYQEFLPGITLNEINALASEWTSTSNRVITVQAPEQEDVAVPTEADLLAVFDRIDEVAIEPYIEEVSEAPLVAAELQPVAITARDSIPEIGVSWWTLANGVRVCLKPTDFKNDQILIAAYSPGGNSLITDADYIAAATADVVVNEGGVSNFDQIELQKKLAGKVVSVRPWIGPLREGFSGSASPEDMETMFELVYAYFTAPRQDIVAFQAYREQMEGMIQNRSASPQAAFGDTLQVTLAQYHYRARPWSSEILAEMDLDKSMAFYRDRFADAGDFTFFLVGNFTLEGVEPLIRTYLGGLPAIGRVESWRDVGIDAPRGIIEKEVYRGVEPQSQSVIAFSGPFDYDGWRNNFELAAMAEVLQIKLREVLREDLGGTYGVRVSASGRQYPREDYSIQIHFGSDPERAEELNKVIFEQINSLKTVDVEQNYIDKIIQMKKRQREVQLKENGFWSGSLQSLDFNGVDPRLLIQYPALVEELNAVAIREAAERYFDLENYVRVVRYPEGFGDLPTEAKAGLE